MYLRVEAKFTPPNEMFIPWNAKPIPLGRSLFHRGETYLSFLFDWGVDLSAFGGCRHAVPL
jgi:hypothetical protein